MWQINISGSGLPKILFFPPHYKACWSEMWLLLQNQGSFREQPSVQNLPATSQALTHQSAGSRILNLLSPRPKPWAVALGTSWGHPGASQQTLPVWEASCCRVGLGWGLPWSSPASSPSIFLRPSGASCLFSNSPCASVGLPWAGSLLSYTHWCQWGCVGGIRRKIWLLVVLFPLSSLFLFFFFFLTLLRLSPARCLACPGLLPPLGWELVLCSSCCLARLRCFGSNLGSKHICSAFCFLPPSLLAVKHFIIQTLWKALYKMKLWGYLFWCSRSNSISYFPPLISPSLDST